MQFQQPDTLVPDPYNPLDWNRYGYARYNPIKYTDPTGHYACQGSDDYGKCIPENPDLPEPPEPPDPPEGGDSSTPFDVGSEWLTGEGPRHHEFRDSDNFTELLKKHDHLEDVRDAIKERLKACNYGTGSASYKLSGLQGVPKYAKDYSTLVTFGTTGNLAVTYLGSYRLNYYIIGVDRETRTAKVLIYVSNSSTLGSGTRPPVLGYTPLWTNYVEPVINQATASGPMSKTTQDFWWTETIDY